MTEARSKRRVLPLIFIVKSKILIWKKVRASKNALWYLICRKQDKKKT